MVVDRYQKKASNIIDDILTWKPQALSVFTGNSDGLNETVIDAPESAKEEMHPEAGSKRTTISEEIEEAGEDDIREGVPVDQHSDDESKSDL